MRLTLRTLLAYLDDTLEPVQTKEIGEKIAESAFATSLVSRIREVMRRRKLSAPEVLEEGGLDCNLTAEYLDSTLSPDDVVDVEKQCLESDVHLAEVAACHQILTLVLGEPVEIAPETRERMYAIGGSAAKLAESKTATQQKPAETISKSKPVVSDKPTPSRAQHSTPFSETIPDYLKPKPLWRRSLPLMVASVVAGLWIGILIMDPSTNLLGVVGLGGKAPADSDSVSEDDPNLAMQDVPREDNEPSAEPKTSVDPVADDQGSDLSASEGTEGTSGEVTQVAAIDSENDPQLQLKQPPTTTQSEAPLTDANEPEKTDSAQPSQPTEPEQKPVSPTEVATAVPAPPQPAVDAAKPVEVEPVKLPDPVSMLYNSHEGILLRFDKKEDLQDWFAVPHRAHIYANESITSIEPFNATIDVGTDLCQVTLLGGTSLTTLPPTAAGLFGFEIRQGRLTLQRIPNSTEEKNIADQQPSVELKVNGEEWQLDLIAPDTLCGVSITRQQSEKFETLPSPNPYIGALYVVSGSVRFDDGSGEPKDIGARQWLSLTPEDREVKNSQPEQEFVKSMITLPRWLDASAKSSSRTSRQYARLFEKEFSPDQPLKHSLRPVVKNPKPKLSELAVKALAATESVDLLVEALAQSDHEESRLAAIDGLRTWLTFSKENGEVLQEELKNFFHEEEAEIVTKLLWGMNKNDARNVDISNELLNLMEHDNIAIRELAFYHVYRLTGRKFEYRAGFAPAQRNVAVKRWRRYVERESGLVRQ